MEKKANLNHQDWQCRMWDSYNFLSKCPDVDMFRKILLRHELFRKSLDVPGDIVQCGVYKGTGLLQLLKMRQIHIPSSTKKIIGFDLFGENLKLTRNDYIQKPHSFNESSCTGINPEEIKREAALICNGKGSDIELVAGDVCKTYKEYVDSNPDFKISFLYLDFDTEELTLRALQNFWSKVMPGGIVVFDQYAISDQSNAVDVFFKDKPEQNLRAVAWAASPTVYYIKQ